MSEKLEQLKQECLDKLSENGTIPVTHSQFLEFLAGKIEQLENIIISEIEIQKGGDTHANTEEIKSEVKKHE